MKVRKYVRRGAQLVLASGLLPAGGCLARLEQNLDLLLSPEAFGNTLSLPFTTVAPLAQFLQRLVT